MEKVTQLDAFCVLTKLLEQNASNKRISDTAFDFYNQWSDKNSKESHEAIYDLALIDEPGMELSGEEIKELIKKIYDFDSSVEDVLNEVVASFDTFSRFFVILKNDDYIKSKHQNLYQHLENIFFLNLADCGQWEIYQEEVFVAVKEMLYANPYLLIKLA